MDPGRPHTMSAQHLGRYAFSTNLVGGRTSWYFGIADNNWHFGYCLRYNDPIAVGTVHKWRRKRRRNLLHYFAFIGTRIWSIGWHRIRVCQCRGGFDEHDWIL